MNSKFGGNKYSLSSNLIFGSFIIGLANLFLYDPESTTDFIMIGIVLVLRYLLAIMIKRRFAWSVYLLIILVIRSIYRSVYILDNINVKPIAKVNVVLQLVLSLIAFGILVIIPKISKMRRLRKTDNTILDEMQMPFSNDYINTLTRNN
ncbi:hypothetical protein [Pedobacter rhodius]|uniref:Uncharacterized protein n=1 Tax=Pedobacter rhodius TaxID=3004098 RepID=A0ABT4KS76_9SPHI|nr:hypothetical protein [Pedobacter sp. SJ11]MCZ4221784.1 hypothetical protein [Pedobacter sp. SJ11]